MHNPEKVVLVSQTLSDLSSIEEEIQLWDKADLAICIHELPSLQNHADES